jgi:hypothetical protein
MVSSGMLRRVALVRTDVSDELSFTIIRVTRIGELGTTVISLVIISVTVQQVSWVISAYINIRNIFPKSGIFLLGLTACKHIVTL